LMCSGSLAVETLILIVLKPGELMESVPYERVLNNVKFPETSVCVRMVVLLESNSTIAFAIAAPFESETTPEIFTDSWPTTLLAPSTLAHNTNLKTKRHLGVRRPGAALVAR